MNISEMREMPPAEIQSEIEKTREKIWNMRFQAKGEPIESPGALRQLKKDLARLMTVLREKKEAEPVPARPQGTAGPADARRAGAQEMAEGAAVAAGSDSEPESRAGESES
jgi:large subunit ribosomal protein L29